MCCCTMSFTQFDHSIVLQGALEAVSLETAFNKLAGKWQGYFERSRDDGDHGDSDAAPLPGKGKRRSLFQKLHQPSRPQARPRTPCATEDCDLPRLTFEPLGRLLGCNRMRGLP